MVNSTLSKYLEKHAEKGALTIANLFPNKIFLNCVVIPLMGEIDWLEDGLESLELASIEAGLPTLGILVINEHRETSKALQDENRLCLKKISALSGVRTELTSNTIFLEYSSTLSLLIIDLTAPENQFSPKEGVGIARKFGMDLATKLFEMQQIQTKFLHTTDGDVILNRDYFTATASAPETSEVFLHPFNHVGRYEQSRALLIYEMSLRYYVLGMKNAGSPYAFQTIGSTIAISAKAYASVRGFPKRNAGEDFYLLNKASKTSAIYSASNGRIKIKGRKSDRVPFGTGVGTEKYWSLLQEANEPMFYSPETFELLKFTLLATREFSIHLDTSKFESQLEELVESRWGSSIQVRFSQLLQNIGLTSILETAQRTRNSTPAVYRHIMENFDAFKTLRFIHEVRDALFPNVCWKTALAEAPFLNLDKKNLLDHSNLLEHLVRLEESLGGLQCFPSG